MIAEDTNEHRDFFGPDGECVLYFKSPSEAADKINWAFNNPADRDRMARAGHGRIVSGSNTYRDRLTEMLSLVSPA
jgi:spore maturation protein CgeB